MLIKQLTAHDDLCAVSRVYIHTWREAYRGIMPQSVLDNLVEARWMPVYTSSRLTTLVVKEAGRYIGVSAFGKSREENYSGWGEIVSLYMLPEYWGRGYGRILFERAIGRLRLDGFNNIYLWVLADNLRAREFYERNGFVNSGETKNFEIGGKTLPEIKYLCT